MKTLILPGLRADTLAGYLQGLGLLRVLSTQHDERTTLHWSARDESVLTTSLTKQELVSWLAQSYAPSPVVTPWNAGSGFDTGRRSSLTAESGLDAVRSSTAPRLKPLRETIAIADGVVAEGRARGWVGKDFWDGKHKRDAIVMCRNAFLESAQPWLDVAVTLTGDGVAYNPLTGTGGNLGRQDLSATFIQRVLQVMGERADVATVHDWAEALLFRREDVPYLRGTVGQFDPVRAGGVLGNQWEEADKEGFVHPWAFLLAMEGTFLFASALTRRLAANSSAGAWPFFVSATPVGHDSAADEDGKGEQWVPLWPRPARLADIAHLLGEGRVQWRGRTSRTGLEFALALGSLGADRGLDVFRRFVILDRLGQNPLAIPAGRVSGAVRPEVRLLDQPYAWVERVSRLDLPDGPRRHLRTVQGAMYAAATGGGREALSTFVLAFGRLHEAVARSGFLQGKIRPYMPSRAEDWPAHLPDDDTMWIAAGIASLYDSGHDRALAPRSLLTPVRQKAGKAEWADRVPSGVALMGNSLAPALAAMHQLRVRHVRRSTTLAKRYGTAEGDAHAPQIPYANGIRLPSRLIEAFLLDFDGAQDTRIADYLRGLLVLGCRSRSQAKPQESVATPLFLPFALLLPFHSRRQFAIPPRDSTTQDAHAGGAVTLAPRPDWAAKLRAGNVAHVTADALLRLRLGGCPPAVSENDLSQAIDLASRLSAQDSHQLGTRLSAALLLRTTSDDLREALRTVSAVTSVQFTASHAATAPETEGNPA